MDSFQQTIQKLQTEQNPRLAPVQTLRGSLQHRLYSCGLFENQVLAIWPLFEADPISKAMSGRWGDDVSDYPPFMANISWAGLCTVVDEWLATNAPRHWARPVFNAQMMKRLKVAIATNQTVGHLHAKMSRARRNIKRLPAYSRRRRYWVGVEKRLQAKLDRR
jgi:hypothetical protein